jgi:hypothetical protein
MYHLATVFPFLRRFRIPITRDQAMYIMVAINELFLGLDHWFAHMINGTITPREAIPIIFGPSAGVFMILMMILAIKKRELASILVTIVLMGGIILGIVGWFFHLFYTVPFYAPPGERFSIDLFIWNPPILGPLTGSLIGFLGVTSLWPENPPDSGHLLVFGKYPLPMIPMSKARAYFLLLALAILATFISSALDHARTGFHNPWLWFPIITSVFAILMAMNIGFQENPSRADLTIFVAAMFLLILVGLTGMVLHLWMNHVVGAGIIVWERVIKGAPFLAPLLFCDMGGLGLIVMMDPGGQKN